MKISMCMMDLNLLQCPKPDFSFLCFNCRLRVFSLLLKLLLNIPKIQNDMAFLGEASGPKITYFVKGIVGDFFYWASPKS